jgi:hypothetical protein
MPSPAAPAACPCRTGAAPIIVTAAIAPRGRALAAARLTSAAALAGLLRVTSRRRDEALARGDMAAVARCEEQLIRFELALADTGD